MLGRSAVDGRLDDFEGDFPINELSVTATKLVGGGFDFAKPVTGTGPFRVVAFQALDEYRGEMGAQWYGQGQCGLDEQGNVGRDRLHALN
jgi:hypothetical protein